jgi:hypothetical protein
LARRKKCSIFPQEYGLIVFCTFNHLQGAETVLGVKNPCDWLRVSRGDLSAIGGVGIVGHFPEVLSCLYPNRDWFHDSPNAKRSKQRLLSSKCKLLIA